MTDIPTSNMPPTGKLLVESVADALDSAGLSAREISPALFEPDHTRAESAQLLATLAGIVASLAHGLEMESHGTEDARTVGERMTDNGMDAFHNHPFLQQLRQTSPGVPFPRGEPAVATDGEPA